MILPSSKPPARRPANHTAGRSRSVFECCQRAIRQRPLDATLHRLSTSRWRPRWGSIRPLGLQSQARSAARSARIRPGPGRARVACRPCGQFRLLLRLHRQRLQERHRREAPSGFPQLRQRCGDAGGRGFELPNGVCLDRPSTARKRTYEVMHLDAYSADISVK